MKIKMILFFTISFAFIFALRCMEIDEYDEQYSREILALTSKIPKWSAFRSLQRRAEGSEYSEFNKDFDVFFKNEQEVKDEFKRRKKEAQEHHERDNEYFDYVRGHCMKISFKCYPHLDVTEYEEHNGKGSAKMALLANYVMHKEEYENPECSSCSIS